MAEGFFNGGIECKIGERTFRFAPMRLEHVAGELLAWCRNEPIRQARDTMQRIESCRDVFGDETDKLKRAELLKGLEQSSSPDWGEGGQLSGVLMRSRRGLLKQLWYSVIDSATEQGVTEDQFASLFPPNEDFTPYVRLMLRANGVSLADPQKAAQVEAPPTGDGSSSPSPQGSGTPQLKLAE